MTAHAIRRALMENLTLRLEADKIQQLDAEADRAGVSRSEYIRRILSQRQTTTDTGVSQAEYTALQMQCAMLLQTVSTLQTQVDRLTAENDRLTEQVTTARVPALEAETGGVLGRLAGWLGR